ncbi:DHA2 family efflux MFS transporter permease subunit [Alicyclobacillaceae bacterium I2511]|nr:DHA2 family efflux MFS transporter permease subunit [Alicyclobacillaceae bacterium I2511]
MDQAIVIQGKRISPYIQLLIIVLGVFMSVLDSSIVNVALPKMEAVFGASTSQIEWVLTGYTVTYGVVVPLSGWLSEMLGPKKLFMYALWVFTVGSIVCGAAWNLNIMISARVFQALGGGFLMPVGMGMVFRLFPPERRGVAMGIFGIGMVAAPAFGPVLSGYFVENSSWRLIFYLNVPVGILTFVLGWLFLQEFSHKASKHVDVVGFILSVIASFSLLYGFNEVPTYGWHSLLVLSFISLGTVALTFFILTELMVKEPLLELRIFKNYMFSLSVILSAIVNTVVFVGLFLMPLYLENIVGYSAIRTGLFMTPAALASAVAMATGGRLFDRIGARPIGVVGISLVLASSYGFSFMTTQANTAGIQTLYILRNFGMGLVMMPIITAGMNTIPKNLLSQATGITDTVRQLAMSLGTAVLTTYLVTQSTKYDIRLGWQVNSITYPGRFLTQLGHLMSGGGATGAHQAAVMVNNIIVERGFVSGMDDTYWITFLLAVLAWFLNWFFANAKERAIRRAEK